MLLAWTVTCTCNFHFSGFIPSRSGFNNWCWFYDQNDWRQQRTCKGMSVVLFKVCRCCTTSLWSPYVIGQTIIFLPCDFYLSFFFLFFPRLISAAIDWMSTILPHLALVWIYDAGLKPAAHSSLEMQDAKNRQKPPSGHHRTTLSVSIFATKAHIDNRKKTC